MNDRRSMMTGAIQGGQHCGKIGGFPLPSEALGCFLPCPPPPLVAAPFRVVSLVNATPVQHLSHPSLDESIGVGTGALTKTVTESRPLPPRRSSSYMSLVSKLFTLIVVAVWSLRCCVPESLNYEPCVCVRERVSVCFTGKVSLLQLTPPEKKIRKFKTLFYVNSFCLKRIWLQK